MTIVVDLTEGQQAVAEMLANMRHGSNRTAGVKDARRDNKMNPIKLDMLGTLSEIAWGAYWDRCPDLTINPRSGGEDFRSKDGKRIDIKATDRPDGRLLAVTGKRKSDVDVYVLAVVSNDGARVTFVGWASADELINDSTLTDLGHGPTHSLPQHRLHPITPRRD